MITAAGIEPLLPLYDVKKECLFGQVTRGRGYCHLGKILFHHYCFYRQAIGVNYNFFLTNAESD